MWFVKMLTGEFEIEPSSVNEASAQSFSHAHFQELFSNIMKTKNYTQEQQLKMRNIKQNNNTFNCI
jgi:hypothetical protein